MAEAAATQAPSGGAAVKRGPLRVIIFNILSGGLYQFYWFYQTRGVVTKAVNGKDQVGLQTLGLIVPILNLFIGYWLLRDVDKFNKAGGGQGLPVPPIWMILIPVVIAIIPPISFLAGIVGLVFLIFVILRLNDALTKQGATNAPYTTGEILTVLAGVILWVVLWFVVLAGLFTLGTTTGTETIDLNSSTYSY